MMSAHSSDNLNINMDNKPRLSPLVHSIPQASFMSEIVESTIRLDESDRDEVEMVNLGDHVKDRFALRQIHQIHLRQLPSPNSGPIHGDQKVVIVYLTDDERNTLVGHGDAVKNKNDDGIASFYLKVRR
jgi:hypothetical protein